MRLFQQFNEMLAKWLNKKRFDNVELVVSFNDEVVKPFLNHEIEFYEAMDLDDITKYSSQVYPNLSEKINRLEILAESFYQKSFLVSVAERQNEIRTKALHIFKWINENDSTYSIHRENRITELAEIDC